MEKVTDETIFRCWGEANILPATWNSDINNSVGSGSLSQKEIFSSDELSIEL